MDVSVIIARKGKKRGKGGRMKWVERRKKGNRKERHEGYVRRRIRVNRVKKERVWDSPRSTELDLLQPIHDLMKIEHELCSI
jgi:hypothetical protein